jgi:hypothetical protein
MVNYDLYIVTVITEEGELADYPLPANSREEAICLAHALLRDHGCRCLQFERVEKLYELEKDEDWKEILDQSVELLNIGKQNLNKSNFFTYEKMKNPCHRFIESTHQNVVSYLEYEARMR